MKRDRRSDSNLSSSRAGDAPADGRPTAAGSPGTGAGSGGEGFRDVVVVLMAGGSGTRFWPLSTPSRPKQFLTELTGRSLYEQAVERARLLARPERVLVLTNEAFAELVREQSPAVPASNVFLEPIRRDTAAATILAAVIVEHRWPGSVMIVMPSDHLIGGLDGFRRTMASAVERARKGGLGTIGIRPTHPATGFGYLEVAEGAGGSAAVAVERFVEKPDRRRAEEYVSSGRHLWNSGMFIWKSATFLDAARRHLPGVFGALSGLAGSLDAGNFEGELRKAFESVEAMSVDYGIMERHDDVWTVPATFEWGDLGGWPAACDLVPADGNGNRVRGRVLVEGVRDSLVISGSGHPIIVAGLEGCVVVQGPGGTLVCRRDVADQIKPLVERVLRGEGT